MLCLKCGKTSSDCAKFCINCGSLLDGPEQSVVSPYCVTSGSNVILSRNVVNASTEEQKGKTIALYKYVKELCALKYKVVTDINKQYWNCFLQDIPEDPENIIIYYRDRVEEESNGDTILLKVKKPEFERCPDPPTEIIDWLEPGWDRFNIEARLKTTLISGKTTESNDTKDYQMMEHFYDSEKRIVTFNKWLLFRKAWTEKQYYINRTRKFFANLFQIYTDLERDSETLELIVGEGIIQDVENASINHPILLKRVKFDFDAKSNVINVRDTDTEPELYTLLLQEMQDISHSAVMQLKDDLHENFYHPLDRNDSPDFLKILTHRLCSDSAFITNTSDKTNSGDRLITRLNPVYFVRKRIDGTLKAIDRILATIEDTDYVPGHLLDLVGGGIVEIATDNHEPTVDEQLASLNGESLTILFSKEANREQLEIAERIEHYNAVLVQGPPGTGKTHTIANLLGHFLAQGKSVLVTSHTKKALSVLKDKIPDEIRNLCVSILDDTNLDMIRSVEGISEYLSKYTSNELKKKVESAKRERTEIINRLADVRKKLYAIKCMEFEPIVYNGESYSPAQAADFVHVYSEKLSYIPGKVKLYHPLPVTVDTLTQLYRSNGGISETEEVELEYDIPDPKLIPIPSSFAFDMEKTTENQSIIKSISTNLGLEFSFDFKKKSINILNSLAGEWFACNLSAETLEQLSQYLGKVKNIDGWMIHAAVDGHRGGGYRKQWDILIQLIADTAACADVQIAQMLGQKIVVDDTFDLFEVYEQLNKLLEIFQKKRKISKIDILFNKQLEKVLSGVKINNKSLSSSNDCQLVMGYLTLIKKREETALLWNELMAKHGVPEFSLLGKAPEQICLQMIPSITQYLDWYEKEYTYLFNLVSKAGLSSDLIFAGSDLDSDLIRTEKLLKSMHEIIPLHISIANSFLELASIDDRRSQIIYEMKNGKRKCSVICNTITEALENNDASSYEKAYYQLVDLFAKYSLKKLREDVLALIAPIAPQWATAIKNREGIHGESISPHSIEDAWKWKQFAGIIDSITDEPFEELQHKAIMIGKQLRIITSKVASKSAWYHLLVRTESNLSMKQALQGWKLTVKKIGKGTGKNAPAMKREARELMAKCQTAVPAWIMTVNKALESLDPSKNSFDIIIIDEASQSDVSALGILYMAKKIIIVGDDKQVSPMAVGVVEEKMRALQEMYIKGAIPNWHLYDAKTSIYDIASTTFQPLMLREHFRCVPSIIGYSNKLSYDFKIKPLRDASTGVVSPPIVKFRVDDGQREGKQKTNTKEAEAVVSLMMACIEQKEYDSMTFGAISLLGDDQALKMQQIILQKIEPAIIEQRHILCGNASHFQGDQRNVIFLSLVDSNEGDGPLSMAGEGPDQSRKQRYNVAASRAKDQLWVVHSLDYTRDLKKNDLRRDLLEYAENPQAYAQLAEVVKARSESPFEETVGKAMVAAGYNIVQQWQVGAYRIDMVVLFQGNKVAVECDGERFHHGDEKVREDMERQAILERLGWRFIRIRGSEYYRNPEKTMDRVFQELNKFGIFPESIVKLLAKEESSELLSRVKIRAAQIIDEWHLNIEDENTSDKPSALFPHTPADRQQNKPPKEKPSEYNQISFDSLILKQQSSAASNSGSPTKPAPTGTFPRRDLPTVKPNTENNITVRSSDSLVADLRVAGIKAIDLRENGGALWIIGGLELAAVVKEYGKKGVIFRFKPNGGKATANKDAWWLK